MRGYAIIKDGRAVATARETNWTLCVDRDLHRKDFEHKADGLYAYAFSKAYATVRSVGVVFNPAAEVKRLRALAAVPPARVRGAMPGVRGCQAAYDASAANAKQRKHSSALLADWLETNALNPKECN